MYKKLIIPIMVLVFLGLCISLALNHSKSEKPTKTYMGAITPIPEITDEEMIQEETPVKNNIIVIDPGHGGNDPGKVAVNDVLEKDINLTIGLKLRDYLIAQGYEVVMTRTEDVALYSEGATTKKRGDLKARAALINETMPLLVVSIHQNSYPDESCKGAQVFYYEESETGERLAKALQSVLVSELDPTNHREIKTNDSYYILKETSVPTIIVECGFLSNPNEAELLSSTEYQDKVAQTITMGIMNYLQTEGESEVQTPETEVQN